jgi:hypothetical protein
MMESSYGLTLIKPSKNIYIRRVCDPYGINHAIYAENRKGKRVEDMNEKNST